MPLASLRPCGARGCPQLTRGGPCANHARHQQRTREARRLPAHERGYDAAWYKKARRFRMEHPLCVLCGLAGQCVDHKIPHRGDEALFNDESNWQTLCRSCHSTKTAREDGGFGNRRTA